LIINSPLESKEISKLLKNKIKSANIYSTPATDIALHWLGKNIVNTVILGAFIKKNKIIKLDTLLKAVAQKFADKGKFLVKKNQSAVTAAYNYVHKEK
jgi:pyruvate ferredoxin oxidoreductase gamma subunit